MAAKEEQADLYGQRAPVNLSIYGYLFTFGAGVFVALTLGASVLSLLWGTPPARPLLDLRSLRFLLWGGALAHLAALAFSHRNERLQRLRGLLIAATLVLVLLSVTPLFSPHHLVVGLARSLEAERTKDMLLAVISLVAGVGLTGTAVHSLLEILRFKSTATHGSTMWGDGVALKKQKAGLLLGWHDGQMLRYGGDGHLLTVAATRSGKGVGAIIPNLLSYPGSIVVSDPKGENYYVTARYRRETLGQEVVALDPFNLTRRVNLASFAFNPLDLIDLDSQDYVETAMMMADMMVVQRGMTHEPHWDIEAKALLYALILYVRSLPDKARRHLIEMRRLLTQRPDELEKTLARMLESPIDQVREGAGRILQKADKERSGVFSTAQSHTHFLSSPRMAGVLTATGFDIQGLLRGELSLYLVLPREHLSPFAPWLRLMISCCYYTCTHNALQRGRIDQRVLFLLDEFANLGYMANIKEAVSLGGGYGLTLWLILQDLAQLRREYRDEWESFVANSDVIQAFAIQDPFTSEKISKMLGETTVWQRRVRGQSRREGGRFIRDYEERSRHLLRGDELRRLHPRRQLLLVRPYQPVLADKIIYFEDPFLTGRFDANPYITPIPAPS
ncbi:MAG: type IV secretory system conjugative DNA transfer family protein [Rhodothermales bacterium]